MSVDTKKCIITGNDSYRDARYRRYHNRRYRLICSKDKAQNMKEVLQKLKKRKAEYL
ncbi:MULTISPECIES: hypothetical protein [Thermoanaerobacterium]|uniref:hypothetical protein n=1 Tax=Thermoanaerobacterium TaxID=28895 RepID=UPI0002FC5D65|nr:hypothetical protein [Thermoanaerobacterium xylanolyticum]